MTTTTEQRLVDTAWLEEHLADADLRIIDCTVYLPNYFEESAGTEVEIVPGRADYETGHIPRSVYADLVDQLTDDDNGPFMSTMPAVGAVRRRHVSPGRRTGDPRRSVRPHGA